MAMKLYVIVGSQPCKGLKWFIANQDIKNVEIVTLNPMAGELSTPEYLAKNAMGQVPLLELEDGTFLTESAAIIQYLASINDVGTEYPESALERARVHEALHQVDSLARKVSFLILRPMIGKKFSPAGAEMPPIADIHAANAEELSWALGVLDAQLGKQKYAAGDQFTIADYQIGSELNQLPVFAPVLPDAAKLEKFANIARYLEDIKVVKGHDATYQETAMVFGMVQ